MRHFVLIQGNINYQVKLLKDFKLLASQAAPIATTATTINITLNLQ
jgi:hypothetical protein